MLIVGVVLLALAAVAVVVAVVQQRRWQFIAGTETLTSEQLREQAGVVTDLGGAGTIGKVCGIVGVAQPGPDGPTTATMSKVTCVWHRHEVRRRYERYVSDGKGNRRRRTGTEQVSSFASAAPFTVADDTGTVVVAPEGAWVDRPERVHKEFQPGNSASLTALGVTVRLGNSDGTTGFDTEEWAIRPGTTVYVVGQVNETAGQLRLTKPDQGRFTVSTRTKAELTARGRRNQRVAMALAAVAAAAGVVVIILALL